MTEEQKKKQDFILEKSDITVKITGEPGVGKSHFARGIHDRGARRKKKFISKNCAYLESGDPNIRYRTLFGNVRDAWNEAAESKGIFEESHEGTVFLDELTMLDDRSQASLLTFLDNGEVTRLGSTDVITVDVRLIWATNADIEAEIRKGKFRQDLYDRLNGFPIHLLPLRERLNEIEGLVKLFIREFNVQYKRQIQESIDDETLQYLREQPWKDNIRGLKDATKQAFASCLSRESTAVKKDDFLVPEEAAREIPFNIGGSGKQENFVAKTENIKAVVADIERVAPLSYTVLITGERGTGVARSAAEIHDKSPRQEKPFIHGNCAMMPVPVAHSHSELFGNENTGIRGLFEQATGGTLFLDDIDAMSTTGQAVLLHVLDTQAFPRLGSDEVVRADVRLIAATNADLEECVRREAFRRDLYDKLKEYHIEVPPLRDRPNDIKDLVEHFIREFNAKNTRQIQEQIDDETLKYLREQTWPGNIRQLKSATLTACIGCKGGTLKKVNFPSEDELSDSEALTLAENQKRTAFKKCVKELTDIFKEDPTYEAYMNKDPDFFTIYVCRELEADLPEHFSTISEMSLQEMLTIKGINRNTYYNKRSTWKQNGELNEKARHTVLQKWQNS